MIELKEEVPVVGDGYDGIRKALVVMSSVPSRKIGRSLVRNGQGPVCALGWLDEAAGGKNFSTSGAHKLVVRHYGLASHEAARLTEISDRKYSQVLREDQIARKLALIQYLRSVLEGRLGVRGATGA